MYGKEYIDWREREEMVGMMEFRPAHPDTIYGVDWEPIINAFRRLFRLPPSYRSRTVYVGPPRIGSGEFSGASLQRSNDGGKSWTQVDRVENVFPKPMHALRWSTHQLRLAGKLPGNPPPSSDD